MFFKATVPGKNSIWRYLITLLIATIAYTLGSLPLIFYIVSKGGIILTNEDLIKYMGELPEKNLLLFLMLFIFVPTAIAMWFCIRVIHNRSLTSVVTGAKQFRWNQYWFAFFATAILLGAFTAIGYFLSPDDYVVQFNLKKFVPLFIISLIFISIQAATEELIFRGYLTQGFGVLTKSRLGALLIPAILFGALHLSNPEVAEHGVATMFPLYLSMGLVFGILTLMNDGTELAMGYHVANNFIISLLVTSPEAVLQTHSILRAKTVQNVSDQYWSILVMQLMIIGLFAMKYKWTNWGEKLLGKVEVNTITQREEFIKYE